ncbi:hypothetical protein CAQUA_07135 [Corynebacterium aquatimens]|nr:hypothetical protein CAQUA_07135 [Corynebacterium aquatimens]
MVGCSRSEPLEEPELTTQSRTQVQETVTEYTSESSPADGQGTVCGTAFSNFSQKTYDIVVIGGEARCDEAMTVVTDFLSGNSRAIKDGDEAWQAINGWRCGRGVDVGEVEPGGYTMNCWNSRTRVAFIHSGGEVSEAPAAEPAPAFDRKYAPSGVVCGDVTDQVTGETNAVVTVRHEVDCDAAMATFTDYLFGSPSGEPPFGSGARWEAPNGWECYKGYHLQGDPEAHVHMRLSCGPYGEPAVAWIPHDRISDMIVEDRD